MLCAVNQAAYLLKRQVEQQSREFLEKGGFTERLYAARVKARAGESDKSDRSDSSDKSDVPICPRCGQPMRKRTARNGPHAGQAFWGCSAYPKCKATREISEKSDPHPPPADPRPTAPRKNRPKPGSCEQPGKPRSP
jgi:four helix bundle suffix protein